MFKFCQKLSYYRKYEVAVDTYSTLHETCKGKKQLKLSTNYVSLLE
jgi:hypothetical protein